MSQQQAMTPEEEAFWQEQIAYLPREERERQWAYTKTQTPERRAFDRERVERTGSLKALREESRKRAERYGTPEEMAAKEAILKMDFSKASGEEMANLFFSWATEDGETEMEDALRNLPRKGRTAGSPGSL